MFSVVATEILFQRVFRLVSIQLHKLEFISRAVLHQHIGSYVACPLCRQMCVLGRSSAICSFANQITLIFAIKTNPKHAMFAMLQIVLFVVLTRMLMQHPIHLYLYVCASATEFNKSHKHKIKEYQRLNTNNTWYLILVTFDL